MITFFTTAKAFDGHSGIIQCNALKSWTLLHPDVEVILFGDEPGSAEAARDLGLRHVPGVERVSQGPKILRSFFDPAQHLARHEILCYINCDIILTEDFLEAVRRIHSIHRHFFMFGRRWDIDINAPIPFEDANWEDEVRALATRKGVQRSGGWIDYFVFPRGFYLNQLPEFVIGRVHWDQWLVWKARCSGLPVVDVSEAVLAIHQNHDYGYHPAGREGVWTDELAMRNLALAGGRWHLCTIEDATYVFGANGLQKNPQANYQAVRRALRTSWEILRLGALGWTRPLRHAIGLRKKRRQATTTSVSGLSR